MMSNITTGGTMQQGLVSIMSPTKDAEDQIHHARRHPSCHRNIIPFQSGTKKPNYRHLPPERVLRSRNALC